MYQTSVPARDSELCCPQHPVLCWVGQSPAACPLVSMVQGRRQDQERAREGGRTQLRMKGQNRLPTGFGDDALQLGGLWSTPGRGGLEDSLAEAEDGGRHQRPFGRRDVVAGKGRWAGEEVPL